MSRRLIALLAVCGLLAACGTQDQTELRAWMSEQTKGMRGGVKPLPEIKPLDAVAYEGDTLIVPFSPQKIVATEGRGQGNLGQADRPRQPLENFPLEDLQVRGIILTAKQPYALIQPKPPNKPMHVGVGDYIGQNFGRIISITSDELKVLETVKDTNGAWTEREIVKPVPREGGKK